MTFPTLLALAFALAVDAFAVAMASGAQLRCISTAQAARMAGTFGFFQFAMPVAGWLLGMGVQHYIESYDHWVAFGLLAFVGGRMLGEAWRRRGMPMAESCDYFGDPTTGTSLVLLGLATSIDALAVGISLAILGEEVWYPAAVIGIVCFMLTAVGLHLGRAICSLSGNWANRINILGGLVLFGIGLNILREHGVFGG